MPFAIAQQDITKMKVDAIVNAANTDLQMGGGVCGAIFKAAGAKQLQAACDKVAPIKTGGAAVTPGFDLPAKYVIHAAGPVYSHWNKEQNRALLRSAYIESMKLAGERGCESIAFPLISSGIYGYPKDEALEVARLAVEEYLQDHDMEVYLVVFDKSSFLFGEALLGGVESYIDQHYVDTHQQSRWELLDKLHRAIESYQDANLTQASVLTLGEWLDRWLEEYAAQNPAWGDHEGLSFFGRYNIMQGDGFIGCVETADRPAISFDFRGVCFYCVVKQRGHPATKEVR